MSNKEREPHPLKRQNHTVEKHVYPGREEECRQGPTEISRQFDQLMAERAMEARKRRNKSLLSEQEDPAQEMDVDLRVCILM